MKINFNESQYALRICVLNALNQYGDVITQFTLKDLREPQHTQIFDNPEGTSNDFFWVNENTCPTNLLRVDSEMYSGSLEDPHGLLIQIGLIPEVLVKNHVELINLDDGEWDFTDGNGSNGGMGNHIFFNKLIRLYKSVHHMLRNTFLSTDLRLGTGNKNLFDQVVYFEAGHHKGMARINWLVCEMLKEPAKYLDLMDNPKGRILDINQRRLGEVINTHYNELIFGLPELLLGEEGLGIEKVIDILLPQQKGLLLDAEGMKHHLTTVLTRNYYDNDSVFKSYTV